MRVAELVEVSRSQPLERLRKAQKPQLHYRKDWDAEPL
jgi:hypothetical protein